MEVQELLKLYAAHPQVTALDTLLKNDTSRNIFLKGLNGSGPAMTIASLFTKGRGSYVCVLNDQEEAGYFYHDLMQLTASNEVYFFPSAYRRAIKYGHVDPANEILRTEVLSRLQDPDASFVIVTYPDALAERVVAREVLKENTLKISVGEKLDNMFVSDVLDEYGFEQVDYVYEPGQYALRGSILDVFSFSNEFPYRIDFFGDEVETIRTFDVETQLSKEKLDSIYIVPEMSKNAKDSTSLLGSLPPEHLHSGERSRMVQGAHRKRMERRSGGSRRGILRRYRPDAEEISPERRTSYGRSWISVASISGYGRWERRTLPSTSLRKRSRSIIRISTG